MAEEKKKILEVRNVSTSYTRKSPLGKTKIQHVLHDVSFDLLNADWSGSFVYMCTEKAGMGMPLRYPDTRVRHCFAAVSAWEQYARLPKIRLWHTAAEPPEVGDLAVLEHEPGGPGQMGVVLSVDGDMMELAMGNYHNHSAIVEHSTVEGVRGYIRLED